ncbi:hypothetical protein DYU11_01575 [Fibrisoma montanum]|uniref:Uncharacterized protein n=1 Tax=Fibrisoma montanum TaxID=2305895 RepID=A0A418MI48_9BACT|nr:hypothetical protein [Fibrisoma montanum]RIV27033.1 hypothetical protein DYU11_01575 [Fibrisoma montanum]
MELGTYPFDRNESGYTVLNTLRDRLAKTRDSLRNELVLRPERIATLTDWKTCRWHLIYSNRDYNSPNDEFVEEINFNIQNLSDSKTELYRIQLKLLLDNTVRPLQALVKNELEQTADELTEEPNRPQLLALDADSNYWLIRQRINRLRVLRQTRTKEYKVWHKRTKELVAYRILLKQLQYDLTVIVDKIKPYINFTSTIDDQGQRLIIPKNMQDRIYKTLSDMADDKNALSQLLENGHFPARIWIKCGAESLAYVFKQVNGAENKPIGDMTVLSKWVANYFDYGRKANSRKPMMFSTTFGVVRDANQVSSKNQIRLRQ